MTFLQIHAVWIPRCSQQIFFYFILHLGWRLGCWVQCTSFSTLNAYNYVSITLTAFSVNIFPVTAAKPYATAHISIFFFYCWEYPVSSSTLVLAHPLKINHLLKANSFVPCLGTLPSHLDNKDGKRARWRILWDGEEYSKKLYFTWVINDTFLNAHWDF